MTKPEHQDKLNIHELVLLHEENEQPSSYVFKNLERKKGRWNEDEK